MFESLSEKLSGILDKLTGRGALSEEDVNAAMREVRRALLEADVALDDGRFGLVGKTAQPKLERHWPSVHTGALRHARVFSMLNDAQPYSRSGGQGFSHDAVFQDGQAVI